MKELVTIQTTLKAPKNQRNKFGKYNYRSCEDILEGLKPLLAEQNCVLIVHDEMVLIGERYYVKATATISNQENVRASATAYAREGDKQAGMAEAQLTGSTSSYARKYALNGLFCIDDTKDADSNEHSAPTNTKATKAQVDIAKKLTGEAKTTEALVCKALKIKNFEELDSSNYGKAINALNAKIKKLKEADNA